MSQCYRVFFITSVLLLGACKTPATAVLKASTELDGKPVDLNTYLATPEVLAAYRKEVDRNEQRLSGNPMPGGLSGFCALAIRGINKPSYRSRQLPYHKLHIEEIAAIVNYGGAAYRQINKALRDNDNTAKKENKYSILTTASALNRLPNYSGKVYRGVNLEPKYFAAYTEALKNRQNVAEKSFFSTTLDPKIAENYAALFEDRIFERLGEGDVRGLFIISSKRGRVIEGIAPAVEREVLFSPGSEFKVLSVVAKTREEYEASRINAPQPPARASVEASSDPLPELKGCESPEDTAKLMAGNSFNEEGTQRFVGPIGDLNNQGNTAFLLNDEDLAKKFKDKIVVVEMEEVIPSAPGGGSASESSSSGSDVCKTDARVNKSLPVVYDVSCTAASLGCIENLPCRYVNK